MTVGQLIHELSSMSEDAEVRIASQQNWPFEYDIATVAETDLDEMFEIMQGDNGWQVEELGENGEVLQDGFSSIPDAETWLRDYKERMHADFEPAVYISEGTQLGYLPAVARAAVGW